MMTIERKAELANKIHFVSGLEDAVRNSSDYSLSSVEAIDYEIYQHKAEEFVREYLVVTFVGGAKSVRNCNGTSCYGILRSLAKIIGGGYYDEIPYYEELKANRDYELILQTA